MKLLLDENLPKRLKQDFREYAIYTVAEMGWAGRTNGELLKVMLEEGFTALLTFDKNLQHQQNFQRYSVTVFVLSARDNTYLSVQQLVPRLKEYLETPLLPGPIEIKL